MTRATSPTTSHNACCLKDATPLWDALCVPTAEAVTLQFKITAKLQQGQSTPHRYNTSER